MLNKTFNRVTKLKLFKKFFKKNPRTKFIQRLYSEIRFLRKERFITAFEVFIFFLIAKPQGKKFNEINNLSEFKNEYYFRYNFQVQDALNVFFKEGEEVLLSFSRGWKYNNTFFIYCPNFQYAKSTFYAIKDPKQRGYEEYFKEPGSRRKKILISNNEIFKADNHIFTFEVVKKLVGDTVIKIKKTNIDDYLEQIIKYRKGNIKTYNFYSVHANYRRPTSEYRQDFD